MEKSFSRKQWLRFSLGYGLSKAQVLADVESPKAAFLLYEARYSFANFMRTVTGKWDDVPVWTSKDTLISTCFGKFRVREGTQDAAIVSPAFERADVDRMMSLVRGLVDQGKRILFLDAGANIGKFSVSILHTFAGRPIRAVAIEPSPANLELLEENRRLNGLEEQMRIVRSAIHEKAGTMTLSFDPLSCGRSTLGTIEYECDVQKVDVPVIRLDDLELKPLESEVLIMKIDIEGFEIPALKGAAATFERFREIYVMTEDTTNTESIYDFLRGAGFTRLWRVTPYNSCWMRKR